MPSIRRNQLAMPSPISSARSIAPLSRCLPRSQALLARLTRPDLGARSIDARGADGSTVVRLGLARHEPDDRRCARLSLPEAGTAVGSGTQTDSVRRRGTAFGAEELGRGGSAVVSELSRSVRGGLTQSRHRHPVRELERAGLEPRRAYLRSLGRSG